MTTRLVDCFMDLIVYVSRTVRHIDQNQPTVETVKADIDRFIESSRKCMQEARFSDEDYHYACLSICVWIDEALMNASWEHKWEWYKHLLQRRYYNITDGGQEFFDRLDRLGHEDRDLREVAYYCLTLGLAGRYVQKGDGVVLDHLKSKNLKRLFGSSAGEPALDGRQLFPEAYQRQNSEPAGTNKKFSFPGLALVIGVIPIGVYVLMFVVYRYLLSLDTGRFTAM